MLKHNDNPSTHWDTVDKMIARWLHERQELILLFCAVDGLREFTPKSTPVSVKIRAFCQVLMDYVSAGHFEVYEELMQEADDFEDDYGPLVNSIMPKIQLSTELAVDFNDRHADSDLKTIQPEMARELSALGEKLAERFELEDRLIKIMHQNHREMVA